MKSVHIWSFSGPYFPAFGLNTERYSVSLRLQSECWKIRTTKTPKRALFTQRDTNIFNNKGPLNKKMFYWRSLGKILSLFKKNKKIEVLVHAVPTDYIIMLHYDTCLYKILVDFYLGHFDYETFV